MDKKPTNLTSETPIASQPEFRDQGTETPIASKPEYRDQGTGTPIASQPEFRDQGTGTRPRVSQGIQTDHIETDVKESQIPNVGSKVSIGSSTGYDPTETDSSDDETIKLRPNKSLLNIPIEWNASCAEFEWKLTSDKEADLKDGSTIISKQLGEDCSEADEEGKDKKDVLEKVVSLSGIPSVEGLEVTGHNSNSTIEIATSSTRSVINISQSRTSTRSSRSRLPAEEKGDYDDNAHREPVQTYPLHRSKKSLHMPFLDHESVHCKTTGLTQAEINDSMQRYESISRNSRSPFVNMIPIDDDDSASGNNHISPRKSTSADEQSHQGASSSTVGLGLPEFQFPDALSMPCLKVNKKSYEKLITLDEADVLFLAEKNEKFGEDDD